MKLFIGGRGPSAIAAVTAMFLASVAMAGPIRGDAEITDGSAELVELHFADTSSPVLINEMSTVNGGQKGTVLGQVAVIGTSDGYFNLAAFGQATHAHESRFQFSESITNPSAIAQALSADFLINAGKLVTTVFESVPGAGEFLEAGYEITMSFAGAVVFHSSALLRQIGIFDSDTSASLTTFGTRLGGPMTHPLIGAPDRYQYAWADYIGTLDLGVLGAGESGLFEYDVRTYVRAEFASCGSNGCGSTLASIGDPLSFKSDPDDTSSIGGKGTFTFSAPQTAELTAVPEPGTLALFLTGLLAAGVMRRNRIA